MWKPDWNWVQKLGQRKCVDTSRTLAINGIFFLMGNRQPIDIAK